MRRIVLLVAVVMAGPALAQQAGKKPGDVPLSPKVCETPPPVVKDIATETVYRDPKRSVVDAVIVDRNTRALAALDRPLRDMIGWSNLWLAKKDAAAASCALTWMATWAQGGAMLGTIKGEQAEGDRKWRTAGMAIAYLKLKDKASPEQSGAIEPWLNSLANRVIEAEKKAQSKNNRHYWAGLAATAVGFATGDEGHKAFGKAAFERGMSDVAADGSLPAELPRGQLAAHLHNYALAPLIVSAEVAARNGQNWYGDANTPIHRLVAFVSSVNADPSVITRMTGAHQKQPASGFLGWQAFYMKRFPGKIKPIKGATGPWEYSWLGGDLTQLAAVWVK